MLGMFRQCRMEKKARVQVAWIPERYAVVGRVLRLKRDDGWLVTRCGPPLSAEYVLTHERDYWDSFASLER